MHVWRMATRQGPACKFRGFPGCEHAHPQIGLYLLVPLCHLRWIRPEADPCGVNACLDSQHCEGIGTFELMRSSCTLAQQYVHQPASRKICLPAFVGMALQSSLSKDFHRMLCYFCVFCREKVIYKSADWHVEESPRQGFEQLAWVQARRLQATLQVPASLYRLFPSGAHC